MTNQFTNPTRTESQTYHVLIIEWDGEQADRRWYRRLEKMVGRVRGDKELSTVERRADKGVIIQEGVILCASASLARTLAIMAKEEFEARAVHLGTTKLTEHFGATAEDYQILGRVERVLGTRGRRPDPSRFVITCLEELQVFEVTTARPLQCPFCQGLRINARKGSARTYSDDGRDIIDLWKATRFSHVDFEPSPIVFDEDADHEGASNAWNPRESSDVWIQRPRDAEAVGHLMGSELATTVRSLPRRVAIDLLDAVHVARTAKTQQERREARVEALTLYFRNGGDPTAVSMAEGVKPDLFDAAAMLEPKAIVGLFLDLQDAARDAAEEAAANGEVVEAE